MQGFVDELRAIGVPAKNILIWDRFEEHLEASRYQLGDISDGTRIAATEKRGEPGGRFDPEARFVSDRDDPDERSKNGTASRLSRLFTTECDKLINLAILKDHRLAGVTLSLKNIAYGICDNNRRFHGRDLIGPFIADVCARPDVRRKFVLHVVDALEGCFDGGPVPSTVDSLFRPQQLAFAFDPVAVDAWGAALIEAERKRRGLPSLAKEGRAPDHIRLAAAAGVGTDDLGQVELRRATLSGPGPQGR